MTEISKRKILLEEELSFSRINESVYAIVTRRGVLCGITYDLTTGLFINDYVSLAFYGENFKFKVVGLAINNQNTVDLTLTAPGMHESMTVDAQYFHFLNEIPKNAYRN